MKKLLLITVTLFVFVPLYAQNEKIGNIRSPRDSVGFCWNADEMDSFIKYLSSANPDLKSNPENLIAAISVHDDYLYAGNVYYPLYKNIRTKEVIIFGVTHGTVRKELGPQSDVIILDEFEKWEAPYGLVNISPLREIIKSKLPKEFYKVSNKAQSVEHSIEAEIPWLQHYNRDVKITPLMITQMSMERMEQITSSLSTIITQYAKENNLILGRDIFFLISNDANHYGEDFNNLPYGMDAAAHRTATDNDRKIINRDLTGIITQESILKTAEDLWPDSTKRDIPLWCGRYPIVFGLQTITKVLKNLNAGEMKGELLKYSDTFTEKVIPFQESGMGVTAVFSYKHWCGWFTEGFTLIK